MQIQKPDYVTINHALMHLNAHNINAFHRHRMMYFIKRLQRRKGYTFQRYAYIYVYS